LGLAISCYFRLRNAPLQEAREKIKALHAHTAALDPEEISELVELDGPDCNFNGSSDPYSEYKHCAMLEEELHRSISTREFNIGCTHLLGFTVVHGKGCSFIAYGLATHSKALDEPSDWHWYTFCKTQYASNPEYGGIQNFINSHLSVLSTMRKGQELGIISKIHDESGYLEHQDLERLAQTVSSNNALIAAAMGQIKDGAQGTGYALKAPILQFKNFERLEAEGFQPRKS
jgi:hypothetical protein